MEYRAMIVDTIKVSYFTDGNKNWNICKLNEFCLNILWIRSLLFLFL